MLLALENPTKEPWWPTRHEAASLPDPCAVVDPAAVRNPVPNAQPPHGQEHRQPDYVESTCRWWQPGLSLGLSVEYRRYLTGDHGATEAAERQMKLIGSHSTGTITGLGEQAFRRDDDGGVIRTREVWARRGNVVVHILLSGEDPADVDALARRALERIELR